MDIRDIHDNLRYYTNHRVTVSGVVTESTGLLIISYFILKDETGEIPVITNLPLPKKGTRITVTGTVRTVVLVDQNLTAIDEITENK